MLCHKFHFEITLNNLFIFITYLQNARLVWNIKCVVGISVVMTLELSEIVEIQLVRVDVSVVMDMY